MKSLIKLGEMERNEVCESALKGLNCSILNLIKGCDRTRVYCVLMDLLKKHKNDCGSLPKVIIKSLFIVLQTTKYTELDIDCILLAINSLLVEISQEK